MANIILKNDIKELRSILKRRTNHQAKMNQLEEPERSDINKFYTLESELRKAAKRTAERYNLPYNKMASGSRLNNYATEMLNKLEQKILNKIVKKHLANALTRTRQRRANLGLNSNDPSIKMMMRLKFAREKILVPYLAKRWHKTRTPSARQKSPTPVRASQPRDRSSSPRPQPATLTRRIHVHPIGSPDNTRVTWSRNANGKISIHKTLTNLNLSLTNAQKNALNQMSVNNAMQTIRELARGNFSLKH